MALVILPRKIYKYRTQSVGATSHRRVVKQLQPHNVRFLQSLGFRV